jgi:hypothetical protein
VNRSPIDLMEEALALLVSQSASIAITYLVGAVPFLLVLLFFVQEMASGYRAERCLLESLLAAAGFFWFSFWNARFSAGLLHSAFQESGEHTFSKTLQCCYIQFLLQGAKPLVWPLAAASIVPFGWVSLFFRSAAVHSAQHDATLGNTIRRSARHASASLRSYWLGLLITGFLGIVLFVNILIGCVLLPELTKSLTGYETSWSRNASHLLGFQTFAIALLLTWFLVNPFLQAFAAVHIFYGEACSDGRDLLRELRRMASVAVILLLCVTVETPLHAERLSPQKLNEGVRSALVDPEFGWHNPRSLPHQSAFSERVFADIDKAWQPVRNQLSRFGQWIRDLLKREPGARDSTTRLPGPPGHLNLYLYLLAGLVTLAILFVFLRQRLAVTPEAEMTHEARSKPDALHQDVLATELPEEEWVQLADKHISAGEHRLAVRALYLANLSRLGNKHLLTVLKSKTNGMYERELKLRASDRNLCEAFAAANRGYEVAWFSGGPTDAASAAESERIARVIRELC